jgi:Uma2 family endonuclease
MSGYRVGAQRDLEYEEHAVAATAVEYVLRSIDDTWCYARWEQLPDDGNRYEVLDGVLYMSTAPGFNHQQVIMQLILLVGQPLHRSGLAIVSMAPIGLIMPGADPVQPDFLLIRRERAGMIADDGRIRGVPDLVAEVLSPSNPELDTVVKRGVYARAGVPEYWIVRPATHDVLVCTQPDTARGDYTHERHIASGSTLESPTLPIQVAVADLFNPPPAAEQ